jgi:hypothetical protein
MMFVFDKCSMKSYMQVIFRGIDWCRQWAMLQRCEEGTAAGKGGMSHIENDDHANLRQTRMDF